MIKLFSVVVSALAVPLIFLAGRQLGGGKVALVAAVLFAASPFQVYFHRGTQLRAPGSVGGRRNLQRIN